MIFVNIIFMLFRLHDRKLCVLGLCTLISMGPARPPAVNECAQQIIPSLILLFDGLKRAYAAKASDTDDEENEEDDSDIDEGINFYIFLYIFYILFLYISMHLFPFLSHFQKNSNNNFIIFI